jgi:exonuclease SbcC
MVEKQKLIADKEQGLEQQQQSIKAFDQQFKATLAATGINDIEAAQKLLESKQKMPEMQQQLTDLIKQPEQLKLEIEQQQTKLNTLQEQALTTMTLEEIVAKQKEIGSKLSIANQEIRTAESILAQQDSLLTKFNNLQEKVQQQVELSEHSQAEATLLETQSPAVTKRKIQQMMIDQLMTKSNQFLENISGRYCIHQRESEQGLALEIEDKAEGSIYRSPQTLSGGESFVVSLSLALGLSSMGTQGQAVESLFLDEGLGTLDE